MADKGFFNWKVIGNPSQVYDELINWDIAPLPHTNRKDDDGFFYIKRKSYVPTWLFAWVPVNENWRITDIYREDESGCSWGTCYVYYYAVNKGRNKYIVLRRECDSCDILPLLQRNWEIVWDRCPCADDQFSTVFSRYGENKSASGWVGATISNEEWFWYIYTSDLAYIQTDSTKPVPGDFVFINWIDIGSTAPCWQSRQIVFAEINENEDIPFKWKVQVSQPWSNISWQASWAIVTVTDEVWFVPSFVWEWGINTIVQWLIWSWDLICDYGNSCIVSVEQHNWTLTYLNEQGYNFYGWVGFDSSSVVATNTNNVGRDKLDSVSFKNFLVFFGKKEISTIVFNETWDTAFSYKLRDDIGIHNKGAHALFNNGLFFVGSDKRIYGASINSSWSNNFNLELEDITKNVFSHMDLIQDDDEVYMDSYKDRLYVFINGRHDDRNANTTKTKILIFDKTYGQWLVHTVCSEVITGIKCWEFIGDNIYEYCGWGWDWIWRNSYTARAEAVIYKNDNHGMTSQWWLWLDMFRRHKLINAIILLWQGQYKADNTYIQVDRYDQYKYSRHYPIDDTNRVIRDWDDWVNGRDVEVNDCFLSKLDDCANVKNPCEWSHTNYDVEKDSCSGCDERRIYDDYCICYDDNAHALSKVHKFELRFDDWYADYWRVSFISSWFDIAYFGWMIIWTESENTFDVDVDPFTTECCSPVKNCPKNSC